MRKLTLCKRMIAVYLLLIPSFYSLAQSRSVNGKTTDAGGAPLPGVTIQVKDGTGATTSKNDGTFTIRVPSPETVLVFSFVGFATQEIKAGKHEQLNVSLIREDKSLQDIIVVGYGTQRKSDVTGAVTSISAKTLEERPVTNALQALQGKAAGMSVSSNMKPGEVPVVSIRGNRSISAANDPLYVVDGIPIVSALGVSSFSINDINPNDIASVEVLKDASATAIYGSRGANGVILISTKKGSKGKVAINYNTTISLDSYKSLTEWMSGGQWIDRWRESFINARNYQPTTNTNLNVAPTSWYPDPFLDRDKMGLASDQVALESVWMGYEWDQFGVTPKKRATTAAEKAMGWPDMVPVYNSNNIRSYDWRGAVKRQGITQNHQLSLSSGNDISRLYLSLGYNNQLGVQKDQDFERFNLNLNGDINATKWFTLGISVLGSLSDQNYGVSANTGNTGSKDLYSRAIDQFPYALPNNPATGVVIRNPGGNLNLWNPLIDIDQSINNRRSSSVMANTYAQIKFTPWLKYRTNFGAQMRNYRNGTWTGPNATGHLSAKPNTAGFAKDEHFSWVLENLLYVDKTFAKVHTLGVTLLQSAQKSRRESIATNVSGLTSPVSMWYNLSANTTGRPDGYSTGFTENTLYSYMGRVNYTLMNKYLLTASGRFDGSSVLAPSHKWEFFPSFALAWKMQDEKFINKIAWINELKPRVGFGVTGNSSVPPYTTSGPLVGAPYVFGSTPAPGNLPSLVQNPGLGWEKTAQWNLGLDFSVLNRRLSGAIEVYEAKTSDLLMRAPLNPLTGYVEKYENIGKTRNRGIELTLTTVNIQKKDFTWTTELNLAHNKEEIVELLNGKQDMIAAGRFIGKPIDVYYHYDNAGIWTNSKADLDEMAKFNAKGYRFYPGTIRVVDQNHDYKIDAADYVVRGSNRPKLTGGITNTFRYKEWSLSSFIYTRLGQMYFGGYPNSYGGIYPNGRVENDVWSFTNTSGRFPMPNNGPVDNFTPAMQFNDGSFVVVRNISLSYDVPDKLIKKAAIKNLQFNIQILNPFIFGGDVVKWGINPDDDTNWSAVSSSGNAVAPLGGTNNNTVLLQSWVFGLRVGL